MDMSIFTGARALASEPKSADWKVSDTMADEINLVHM
jgi:hypothetical protein